MSKKICFLLILFISFSSIYSQEYNTNNTISAEFGGSRHGSGDIRGFTYAFRYNKILNKRFDLTISFEGNLNDGEGFPFTWEDPNTGRIYDSTPHNVVAGFQLNGGIAFNIINSKKHKFGLNPSVFGRYQATSLFDMIVTDYPALTGFPVPIRYYYRENPGNTLAVGGSVRLYYNYRISDKYFIGLNPGLQFDTNGDTILFANLSIGLTL
ncbi:hypothetical protein ACNI3T_00470 [Christiangramia sp. ASW11-125]|uniref:hypothetical protein n=1 Tax=Christiangramia sp. ASW11-125 TaxID=3400701 RepID=UPI003AAF2596